MNKYHNQKVSYDNFSFASKLEAALYQFLKLREKSGEISDIKCQETVYLTKARIIYKPDFSFVMNDKKVFAESKGFETSDWRIKRRLWQHYGPGNLEIYKGSAARLTLHETLTPDGDEDES